MVTLTDYSTLNLTNKLGNMMNIHAKGNKLKLLFTSKKGQVVMQDLFDLPVTSLRYMANDLNRGLKQSDDLFAVVSTEDSNNKLRLDIILEVITIREEENSAKISGKETKQKRDALQELINKKELEAQGELSVEELKKQLADM